jgi:predicted GIY-YIG superfamily endonuclease
MAGPVVYLVHLDRKLGSDHPRGGAGHYLGTTVDLERRLAQHRNGIGARMLAAANERVLLLVFGVGQATAAAG